MTYTPTTGEAKSHQRERPQGYGITRPSDRIPTAVGRSLAALERYEDANAGMVLTSLEVVPEVQP